MSSSQSLATPDFLSGDSEMAAAIRAKPWSATPLGQIDDWPQSLRTVVSLCLASNFPINIIWGPEHVQIYNDGYRVVCGEAHPAALGQAYTETWASAWPAIGEPFARALRGETSYLENQRMFLFRNGYLEETFFTFSLSPIRDESGGIGGLFHPVTETTTAMLGERRTRALRDLNGVMADAKTTADVFTRAIDALSRFDFDLPFVAIYGLEGPSGDYALAAQAGASSDCPLIPPRLTDEGAPWPLAKVLRRRASVKVGGLRSVLGSHPCGPYEGGPDEALLLPIHIPGSDRPAAIVAAGVSPRLPFNEAYQDFFALVQAALSAGLANARTYEEERARTEALAVLDRSKTAFFSNVSHEFRTPLTLMLGPLEDALADPELDAGGQRERLTVAHRNALRLLKLVNSLLDFSRLEAGRAQASFQPSDLAQLTADLASNFRSACERVGLDLTIDCPPLPQPVYVDHDMWEKVVLNLISNAFKFTLAGGISVRLGVEGDDAVLRVRDTGVGIPPEHLPKVFERFHRIEGQAGRTHEGTGIGLSLVSELVTLHGGTTQASSETGAGSEFRVTIPFGVARLPADQVKRPPAAGQSLPGTPIRAQAYVEEALRWLPDAAPEPAAANDHLPAVTERARVLLADDNADMRAYVARILTEGGYEVEAVADGRGALAILAQGSFDLVLSDVMMPVLDGFGLLSAVRQDPLTQGVPFILLSARAGEEARVEGLAAGADDYLLKPFSARELRARIDGAVRLGRQRTAAALREQELIAAIVAEQGRAALRESERHLKLALDAGGLGSWALDLRTGRLVASKQCRENFGIAPDRPFETHEQMRAEIHPQDRDRRERAIRTAIDDCTTFDVEFRLLRPDAAPVWIMMRGQADYDAGGQAVMLRGVSLDVTTRKLADERQKMLLDELNHRVKNTLATVQSIAMQARRSAATPQDFALALEARIVALAGAHDLLTASAWEGALLSDVVSRTLLHHRSSPPEKRDRIEFAGPAIRVGPNAAVSLSMAFHELATNAVKYGALSEDDGQVLVRWNVQHDSDARFLQIEWSERGGPLVRPPERRGFGSRLVEQGLARQLGGDVRLSFDPDGVACSMRLPLSLHVQPA